MPAAIMLGMARGKKHMRWTSVSDAKAHACARIVDQIELRATAMGRQHPVRGDAGDPMGEAQDSRPAGRRPQWRAGIHADRLLAALLAPSHPGLRRSLLAPPRHADAYEWLCPMMHKEWRSWGFEFATLPCRSKAAGKSGAANDVLTG